MAGAVLATKGAFGNKGYFVHRAPFCRSTVHPDSVNKQKFLFSTKNCI